MLALYRAGRPQEALAAYRDGYREFAALGLEPDASLRQLERAMIAQDPALEGPTPAARVLVPRRRRRLLLGGAVAAVVVAGVAMFALPRGHDAGGAATTASQDRVLGIDVATGKVVAAHAVGRTPTSVAAEGDAVWVLNADDATITRIDLADEATETFGAGGVPTDLAAGGGAIWVANGRRQDAQFVGAVADQVSRVDPATHALTVTSALPRRRSLTSNAVLGHLAATPDTIWAIGPDYRVIGLDPATAQITAEIDDVLATAIAAGDAGVWAIEADGGLARLDAAAGPTRPRVSLPGAQPESIAVGAGADLGDRPRDGLSLAHRSCRWRDGRPLHAARARHRRGGRRRRGRCGSRTRSTARSRRVDPASGAKVGSSCGRAACRGAWPSPATGCG